MKDRKISSGVITHMKWISTSAVVVGIVFLFGALIVSVDARDDRTGFLEKQTMVVLRDIGHKLLLDAGDSVSRILPVKQIESNVFELKFQSQFEFSPDTLVKVFKADMERAGIQSEYIVSVFSCNSTLVVYSFEISRNRENIIPCQGRKQPVDCYVIQVHFASVVPVTASSGKLYLFVAAIGFIVTGLAGRAYVKVKDKKEIAVSSGDEPIRIGSILFYDGQRLLVADGIHTELSDKEARILKILATQQNETVSRDRLLKEVWEDEGVFVGRSLDVFISKLRKKLKGDEAVRIANVHGKGYKLETLAA